MRKVLLAFILLFPPLFFAYGQEAEDSLSSSLLSAELRGGLTSLTAMLTLEMQLHPIRHLSIDAGFRPIPFSFYGGISFYPIDNLFLQIQSGYMELTDTPGPDAPEFESEIYGAGRLGLLIGKRSGVQFSLSLGEMVLVDHDYCSNCGFIMEDHFVSEYRDEVKWVTTFELGVRGWL